MQQQFTNRTSAMFAIGCARVSVHVRMTDPGLDDFDKSDCALPEGAASVVGRPPSVEDARTLCTKCRGREANSRIGFAASLGAVAATMPTLSLVGLSESARGCWPPDCAGRVSRACGSMLVAQGSGITLVCKEGLFVALQLGVWRTMAALATSQ
eukprot:2435931-Amphidinium_carterae.1